MTVTQLGRPDDAEEHLSAPLQRTASKGTRAHGAGDRPGLVGRRSHCFQWRAALTLSERRALLYFTRAVGGKVRTLIATSTNPILFMKQTPKPRSKLQHESSGSAMEM